MARGRDVTDEGLVLLLGVHAGRRATSSCRTSMASSRTARPCSRSRCGYSQGSCLLSRRRFEEVSETETCGLLMGLAPSLLGPPQPDEVKALLRRAQAFEAVERCVLGGYIGQRQAGR